MNTKVKKCITSAIVIAGMFIGATPSYAYTVEKGDTMSKIADKNNLSLKELSNLNPQVHNINLIYVGENINTKVGTGVANVSKSVSTAESSEKQLLAKLVEAEAKAEPYKGKVAVAEVVLNRVKSGSFPNSIEDVIYQKGQFSPVSNGAINQKASEDSKKAVNEALNGTNLTGNALFFYNPSTATSRWLDTKETTVVIGNHTFKK